jgi:N-acetylglucosamine-6-sulfatase
MGMRKIVLVVASTALAVLMCCVATGHGPTKAQESPSATPNFVFIITDDMRKDDLIYMPKTRALLGNRGKRFENAYVSLAWCCPSRATIMRGQYAHNHGLWFTSDTADGGWQGYKNLGYEEDNIATRLHDAGYRTGFFGKYLNFYDEQTTAPPGWDQWFALLEVGASSTTDPQRYFDYDVNVNGTTRHYGTRAQDYSTDVLRRQTRTFIDASVAAGRPFFAYVAPSAPHDVGPRQPPTPAPRHENAFDGEQAPRLPSFDEEDVGDKPPWIQSLPQLSDPKVAQIDAFHEGRIESLQAVDELVEGVVGRLRTAGALSNTYVVFTSDNGWHHGEHRIPQGKTQPYQESIRMPLLIRGPGVQAGTTTNKLTLNTDFYPTFTDLAGVTTPEYVDGRSLRPLLEGTATRWRSAILLEQKKTPTATFSGIRTSEAMKYIEYEDGFKELYDLKSDPYEQDNSYEATAPPDDLVTRLRALEGCAGTTCRVAEGGP